MDLDTFRCDIHRGHAWFRPRVFVMQMYGRIHFLGMGLHQTLVRRDLDVTLGETLAAGLLRESRSESELPEWG